MVANIPDLNSPIKIRIAWAEAIYAQEGQRLLQDRTLFDGLASYQKAAEQSRRHLLQSGMVEVCRKCDQEEGGSYCGAGLERHYSARLLLINRLLGVTLPRERNDPTACFFLSERGCLLIAREVLCINYICEKITTGIRPDQLFALREREGEEILLLFQLTALLKKLLTR